MVAEGGGSIPGGSFLRCERCFSSMSRRDFRVNGLGSTSSIPKSSLGGGKDSQCGRMLTMLEVHLNIIASNVGRHGNDRRTVKLSDKVTSRYTIQIGHYNVHENHVVLDTFLDFIHSFKAIKLRN